MRQYHESEQSEDWLEDDVPHEIVGAALARLAMTNRLEMYKMHVRDGGPGILPPGLQEDLRRTSFYLASRGIDLSQAPDDENENI